MWDFFVFLPCGGPDTRRKLYTEKKILCMLRQHVHDWTMVVLAREHGIAGNTLYSSCLMWAYFQGPSVACMRVRHLFVFLIKDRSEIEEST